MSRLRSLGPLAHLARCPCPGPAAPTAGLLNDAQEALGRSGPLHAAGSPTCPTQTRRHNTTRAAPDPASCSPHLPAAPDPASCSPLLPSCTDWSPPAPPAALAAALPPPCPSLSLSAASSLEDSLALVLSPPQLGVQLWEGAHAATGLPWWAAIPATTLGLRAALLPLSLRAYAASANVALLHQAFGLSRAVGEAVAEAAKDRQQQQQQLMRQGAAAATGAEDRAAGGRSEEGEGAQRLVSSSSSSSDGGSGASVSGGGAAGAAAGAAGLVELKRMDLVRRVFAHLRTQHGAPPFGWYVGNALVQGSLVVSLSLALRRMSDSLWPGFTGEGALYFTDLTAQPVYLHTLSTPCGTAGAILPLALVLLYLTAADRSAGGSSPGIHTALKLLVLPLYCGALLQPHAVLIYWLTHAATQLGVYSLAARVPSWRKAAGVPEMLLMRQEPAAAAVAGTGTEAGTRAGAEGQAKDAAAAPLDELLLALSISYVKSGNVAAARTCLAALMTRHPDHRVAVERRRALLMLSKATAAEATAAGK